MAVRQDDGAVVRGPPYWAGNGRLPLFHSWFLLFGVIPIDRRTIQFEVLEEGRLIESSSSRFNGKWRHERTASAGAGGSTVLMDNLVIESRGKVVDSFTRASLTYMFRRRHRMRRRHFAKAAGRTPAVGDAPGATFSTR